MKAMVLSAIGGLADRPRPLELQDVPVPDVAGGEVLIRVAACGVCHTDLDEVEGRAAPSQLPRILGHQIVGRIERLGQTSMRWRLTPALASPGFSHTCGMCAYCRRGDENLCPDFRATGRDIDGGFAEYCVAPAAFTYSIPEVFSDVDAAPLLCAGAIGSRSLDLTHLHDGEPLGLTGFGASAHLVLQLARRRFPQSPVFVFGEPRPIAVSRATWARRGPARRATRRRPRCARSSTRRLPGRRSSRRCAISTAAAVLSSMRFASRTTIDRHSPRSTMREISGSNGRSRASPTSRVRMCARCSESPRRFRFAPGPRRSRAEPANDALHALAGGHARGAIVLTVC